MQRVDPQLVPSTPLPARSHLDPVAPSHRSDQRERRRPAAAVRGVDLDDWTARGIEGRHLGIDASLLHDDVEEPACRNLGGKDLRATRTELSEVSRTGAGGEEKHRGRGAYSCQRAFRLTGRRERGTKRDRATTLDPEEPSENRERQRRQAVEPPDHRSVRISARYSASGSRRSPSKPKRRRRTRPPLRRSRGTSTVKLPRTLRARRSVLQSSQSSVAARISKP